MPVSQVFQVQQNSVEEQGIRLNHLEVKWKRACKKEHRVVIKFLGGFQSIDVGARVCLKQ